MKAENYSLILGLNLTILGKIMIIKALVIPMFTFVASACVVPDKYRKGIESKCFKFIWDGKPDKVKRNTMIGNFEMGGFEYDKHRKLLYIVESIMGK